MNTGKHDLLIPALGQPRDLIHDGFGRDAARKPARRRDDAVRAGVVASFLNLEKRARVARQRARAKHRNAALALHVGDENLLRRLLFDTAEEIVHTVEADNVVDDRADWEARRLVRRAKRRSPAARVLVTGCYAQVRPEEGARVPDVDYVVGLNRMDDLLRCIEEQTPQKIFIADVQRERGVPVLGARALPGHTRAFLKIQEGCDYSCTYCIIPSARGLSRSVAPETIVNEIARLAERGYQEIVLTGIHLGGYGRDLAPKLDLAALIEMILEKRPVRRLRLSSLDPRDVPERLLKLIASSDVLFPHLHICAQAGDDRIGRANV